MAITDKDLHSATINPDGKTYNGRKVIQWLIEATTGTSLSNEEADKIIAEAERRRQERKK